MHNHVSWQQASPCLSSFRGLRASTKHSSVQDNKGESDSSPQVSVAGLTTGAQRNPSPCIDIYLFIYFPLDNHEKKNAGPKSCLPMYKTGSGLSKIFLFSYLLALFKLKDCLALLLERLLRSRLKKKNKKKNQPSTSRLLNLSVVKGLHDASRSLRWQEARVAQEGAETLLWASQNESDSWGSAFHALPAQSNVTWPVPSGRSSVQ